MNVKEIWKLWRIARRLDVERFKSRKFWATVVGGFIMSVGPQAGLTVEQCQWIATIITGYLVGQGIADHGKAK